MHCNKCLFIGNWYNGAATHLDPEPDEDWVSSRKDESRAYQERDEDADIDESGKEPARSLLLCGLFFLNCFATAPATLNVRAADL